MYKQMLVSNNKCFRGVGKTYLLEVIKLLLQYFHLLQVRANLLISKRRLFLIDPLLQFVRLTEKHELLAALLQHVFPLLSQVLQCTIPDREGERDKERSQNRKCNSHLNTGIGKGISSRRGNEVETDRGSTTD